MIYTRVSRCVGSRYVTPAGAVRVDFEDLINDHLITDVYPPGVDSDDDIGLIQLNDTQVHTGVSDQFLLYTLNFRKILTLYVSCILFKTVFSQQCLESFCFSISV